MLVYHSFRIESYYRALSETLQADEEPVHFAEKYVIMEVKRLSLNFCLFSTLFHENYECLV